MTKIYIDTNIFLDFYQSATDSLSVFEEIEKHSSDIVLTEQTVKEFHRNRNNRLIALAKNVKKSSSVTIHTTALVKSLPEFTAWNEAKTNAEQLAREVSAKLLAWSEDESSDPVNVAFERLANKTSRIGHSQQTINNATNRKLLGEPPTSPDKHTIGDELIWETILEHCKEDLIVVSRDKTFLENASILSHEYHSSTGSSLIKVTSKLTDAFELIGAKSEVVTKAESEICSGKDIELYPYPLTLQTKCPKCGGDLEETGFEGGDGDSAWWMYCTDCGNEFFPNQFMGVK